MSWAGAQFTLNAGCRARFSLCSRVIVVRCSSAKSCRQFQLSQVIKLPVLRSPMPRSSATDGQEEGHPRLSARVDHQSPSPPSLTRGGAGGYRLLPSPVQGEDGGHLPLGRFRWEIQLVGTLAHAMQRLGTISA